MTHKYQGGEIIPMDGSDNIQEHYHISYTHNDTYEDGFTVEVNNQFKVVDEWREDGVERNFPTLVEAVRFCFNEYIQLHPGETIEPIWGAGAPNDTLKELGYKWPLVP